MEKVVERGRRDLEAFGLGEMFRRGEDAEAELDGVGLPEELERELAALEDMVGDLEGGGEEEEEEERGGEGGGGGGEEEVVGDKGGGGRERHDVVKGEEEDTHSNSRPERLRDHNFQGIEE